MDRPTKENVAQIEERTVDHLADERFLTKLEDSLNGDGDDDEEHHQGQRFEAARRQQHIDVFLGDAIAIQVGAGRFELALEVGHVAGVAAHFLLAPAGIGDLFGLVPPRFAIRDLLFQARNRRLLPFLIGFQFADFLVDPGLQIGFPAQDFEQWIDGGEVEAPQHGGQKGAHDRKQDPVAIRPGELERPQEVLHGVRLSRIHSGKGGALL